MRLLVGLCLLMVVVAAMVPPVPQDPAYHAFADTRTAFHVPNMLNVASNLPFLLVGVMGFLFLAEYWDHGLLRLTGGSGHTWKHLASAAAAYWILRMLERRRPLTPGETRVKPPGPPSG